MSENYELDFNTEEPSVDAVADVAVEEVAPAVEEAATAAEEVVAEAPAEEVAAEEVAEDKPADPREAEREALRERSRYSEWYVIHSYAGYENRVKTNLESRIKTLNMEDYIFEVAVPIEDVVEIKNGVRKLVKRNKFPGYVLVRMDLSNEEVWGVVRHTPGVTGFVGNGHNPSPLEIDEVIGILVPEGSSAVGEVEDKKGQKGAKVAVEFTDFAVGDPVVIIDGAFATLQATVAEINMDTQKVFVLVEIFGRETRVELSFKQIRAND